MRPAETFAWDSSWCWSFSSTCCWAICSNHGHQRRMLPDIDTLETAYAKAYAANRRGRPTIQLVVNAQGRRYRPKFVTVWRDLPGVHGWVLKRLPDADGVVERLV